MSRTGRLVILMVMAGVAGMAYAGPQAAPAPPKMVPVKKAAPEKKLDMKSLPPAVRATVERETVSATLKGLSKEVEKGKTQYEVETMVNGRTRACWSIRRGDFSRRTARSDNARHPSGDAQSKEAVAAQTSRAGPRSP